jgi:predicted amino acid racemase
MSELFTSFAPAQKQDTRNLARVSFCSQGLRQNCATLVDLCAGFGIEITGVTKATAGNPDIARLMLDTGISTLAESRLGNIRRLRDAGISAPIMLIRAPTFAEITDAAKLADIFLLSDISTIGAVAKACKHLGKTAEIIIMVDLGDMREGIAPAELFDLITQVQTIENAFIVGVGTNLACNIGILPSKENMQELATIARDTEAQIGRQLRYVSAGNSSAIKLMSNGEMPPEINHLRLGESLLLGRETACGQAIKGARTDCFTVYAQVNEISQRHIQDNGLRGLNALGKSTLLTKTGLRNLAVLNLGAVDVEISGLTSLTPSIEIMGFSSDHIIADVTEIKNITVGCDIGFALNYHALTTAMTSPYLLQVEEVTAAFKPLETGV